MAEFLIYNINHWMNKLTSAEIAEYSKTNENFAEQVAGQYVRDDVIEIRPDGFYTGSKARGFNKKVFRLISVPGLKVDTKYQATNKFYKSRFKIPTGSGDKVKVVNNINDLAIIDKGA